MQLKDYIQSNRRGKEANRLEREALNDLFMQDALDGFDTVAGDHIEIIEQLENKYTHSSVAPQTEKRIFLYWSIAASILLLTGFGFYFFWERNENDIPVIAMVQVHEDECETPVDSFESLSIPVEKSLPKSIKKSQQKNMVVAEATQKVMPALTRASSSAVLDTDENVIETVADVNESFTLQLSEDDSSKLIASYIDYNHRKIEFSDQEQTVISKENDLALNEVVVVGYGVQKKSTLVGAAASVRESDSGHSIFGKKEFQTYCQQKADKNVCDGQGATVKISFFINETGKPVKIEYKSFSCKEAMEEMENLLASSPVWTKTNRKVTMMVKW